MKLTRMIPMFVFLTMLPTVGVQARDGQSAATEEWRCFSILDLLQQDVLVRLTRKIKAGVDQGLARYR